MANFCDYPGDSLQNLDSPGELTAQFTKLDHVCYVPAVHDQRMLCCYEICVTIRQSAQFLAFWCRVFGYR